MVQIATPTPESDPTGPIDRYEQQAKTLFNASLRGYSQPPNPQLAVDALNTQAVPEVANALQSGDPLFGSQAPAFPIGQTSTGQQVSTHNPLSPNVGSFDWAGYWKSMQTLQQNIGLGNFSSLGEIPQVNVGYFDGVRNYVQQNPDSAKKWQKLLKANGFYQDGQGNQIDHPVDGQWDSASDDALTAYAMALALPEALYSSDPNRQQAGANVVSTLGNRLGNPINIDDLKKKMQADPSFQSSVAHAWMQTIPDTSNPRHSLTMFANNFGDSALPKDWLSLKEGGVLSNIVDSAVGMANMPGKLIGGLVEKALPTEKAKPGAQAPASSTAQELSGVTAVATPLGATGIVNLLGNLAQGQVDPRNLLADPRLNAEQAISQKLTPADREMLAQPLQQVANSQGWLGAFGDTYGKALTQAQLAFVYYVGDAVGHGQVENPFDSNAPFRRGADAHRDNLMEGIVGTQWVNDHPQAAAITNFIASNIDPTLLLGPVSRLPRASHMAEELGTAIGQGEHLEAALAADSRLKDVLSPGAKQVFANIVRPKATMLNAMRRSLPPILMNPDLGVADRMRLLQRWYREPVEGGADIRQQAIDFLHERNPETGAYTLKKDLQPDQVASWITDNAAHVLHSPAQLYNYRAHLRALTPAVRDRLDEGGLTRLATLSVMPLHSGEIDWSREVAQGVDSLTDLGHIAGADPKTISSWMDRIIANPEQRADLQDAYLQQVVIPAAEKLTGATHDEFMAWRGRMIDARMRGFGRRGARAPVGTGQHQYAVEPDPTKPPDPRDRVATRLEAADRQRLDAIDIERANHEEQLATLAEAYWKRSHPGQQVDPEQAIREFEADPANRAVVDESRQYQSDLARAADQITGGVRDVSKPMFPSQLRHLSTLPFSNFDLLAWMSPKLRRAENTQALMRLEHAQNIWKGFAIAKPSTLWRAMVGDDVMRWSVELALLGSPKAAVHATVFSRARNLGMAPIALTATPVRSIAKGIATVFSKAEQQRLAADFGPELGLDMAGVLDRLDPNDWHSLTPDDAYYRQGLNYTMRETFKSPMVRGWAEAMNERGDAAALDHLRSWYLGSSPEAQQMRDARYLTRNDLVAAQSARRHQQAGAELGNRLQQLDARGATPDQYRLLPRRGTGDYREQVVNRIAWHDQMSNPANAIEEQVRQTHNFLRDFTGGHAPILKWMADGKLSKKEVDQLFRSQRYMLPRINAPKATASAQAGILRFLEGYTKGFMDNVFRPMVGGSRADGAERMRQWYESYLEATYGIPEQGGKWTRDEIQAEALGFARDWLRNNTYQGSRTLGDIAMRNAFPFVGAVTNMDRFFIKQFKAHPWLAGPTMKGGAAFLNAADANSQKQEWPWWSPLSLFHFSPTDVLTYNPGNILFFSSEGLGSMVPGIGPVVMPLVALMSSDSAVKGVMSQVPGWSAHLGQTSFIPSYVQSAVSGASMALGGPSLTLPKWLFGGTTLQPEDYQKLVDEKMRQVSAETGGQISGAQASKMIGQEQLFQGVANYAFPFQVKVSDGMAREISAARSEMDKATTAAERDAVITAHPNVAPALAYVDPRTTPDAKDAIAVQYPWVIPYTTSMYESALGSSASLQDFNQRLASGDEHVMGDTEYSAALHNNYDIAAGFVQYNQTIREPLQQWQQETGLSTSSTQYKQFKAQVLDPARAALIAQHPAWAAKYGATSLDRSIQGQITNSQPISTLAAWSQVPLYPEFENQQSAAMRNIMLWRDETAQEIVRLQAQGGTTDELNQAVQQFHDQVQQLADADPVLSQELDLYHWGQWQDFLDLAVTAIKQQGVL